MLCCLVTFYSSAQMFKKDSLFLDSAIARTENLYNYSTREQSQLYNGGDFAFYQPLENEHPYFSSDDWIDGTILYDGTLFAHVFMQYDIQSDELIVEHANGTRIKLTKLNVGYFILNDRKFVLLTSRHLNGFYEILYDGNTKVYARHWKVFQESLSSGKASRSFREKIRYYIYKNGDYVTVTNKASVYKVFKERKKELRQFASKNKLRFGTNKIAFLTQLANHYDGLQ